MGERRPKDNPPEKRAERVVEDGERVKKAGGFKLFMRELIAPDVENMRDYVRRDVLIPTIKKTAWDLMDMLIYPEGSARKRDKSMASKTSYTNYYDTQRRGRDDEPPPRRTRTGWDYEDEVLTRGAAEAVLMRMEEILDRYEIVRVADVNDLIGIDGKYTDNNYGWTDISTAKVERVRDGYVLKLPRAMPLT